MHDFCKYLHYYYNLLLHLICVWLHFDIFSLPYCSSHTLMFQFSQAITYSIQMSTLLFLIIILFLLDEWKILKEMLWKYTGKNLSMPNWPKIVPNGIFCSYAYHISFTTHFPIENCTVWTLLVCSGSKSVPIIFTILSFIQFHHLLQIAFHCTPNFKML
jgi:hypothetical protein